MLEWTPQQRRPNPIVFELVPEPVQSRNRERRVGVRGIQAERLVRILEHLADHGETSRAVLQSMLGLELWAQDRVVGIAKTQGLIDVVPPGIYRLTDEGRLLLQSPAPTQVLGPRSQKGGRRPVPDCGEDDFMEPTGLPLVLEMEITMDTADHSLPPGSAPTPGTASVLADEGASQQRAAVLEYRRGQVRGRCERWLSGLRPELRARLEAGGHVESLVELACRREGLL